MNSPSDGGMSSLRDGVGSGAKIGFGIGCVGGCGTGEARIGLGVGRGTVKMDVSVCVLNYGSRS